MTIRDLFFGNDAIEMRSFYNESKCLEIRYSSRSMRIQTTNTEDGISYITNFQDENFPNFFDLEKKKYILELVLGGRNCCRGLDSSMIIYLTEEDLDQVLEESIEDNYVCLTLQENRLRDYRLDFLVSKDNLDLIRRRFFNSWND